MYTDGYIYIVRVLDRVFFYYLVCCIDIDVMEIIYSLIEHSPIIISYTHIDLYIFRFFVHVCMFVT